jgi:hypothetical protein
MNFKTTVVLIVLLAIVGIYVFVSRDSETKTEVTEGEQKKLVDVTLTDIYKLTITPADGKKTVLEKVGTGWRLVEPVNAAAETFEVDSLLRAITDLQSRGQLQVTADKASATGLDHPRFKVEVATPSKTHVLNVGEKSAVGDNLYVFVGDSKEAQVVPGDLADRLEKPADTYRNKKLTDLAATDIQQLVIAGPTTRIALQKNGADWQMTEPSKMPAEKAAVDDLLFAITGLKAEEFVSEGGGASTQSFDQARMTVFMSKQPPATQPTTQAATAPATQPQGLTISFGRYDNVMKKNVLAMTSSSPAVAKVQATILQTLGKKPLELRDKRVASIDPQQVSSLTITSDLAATSQPTSRPTSKAEIALVRRKQPATQAATAPAATAPSTASSTQPSTGPATTQAATQPATQPAPPSKWQFTTDEKTDVDDAKVDNLLTSLNPLRVEKYVEAPPTTQPTSSYKINITTAGPGGTPVTQHEIRLREISADQALVGDYNGVVFEVDRSLLTRLQGDFKKSSAAPLPASNEGFPEIPRP